LHPSSARGTRSPALLLTLPLALACYWSARLAYADLLYSRDTLASAQQAVRLDPGNARYLAWLAELEEHDGNDPVPTLTRAAALNPRDSAIRIRLGLFAEQRGDFASAERELLAAARLDRQFDPRATLANYYFRRGDDTHFWRSIREAFAVSYGDLTPMFDLCWRMTNQPAVVRAALGPNTRLLDRYLSFLLAQNRLDAAVPIARELAAAARQQDLRLLLAACDRTFDLATWNALCGRLLPYAPLDPAGGVSLTNPSFNFDPVLHGFDWRIPASPEISVARADSPHALRIALSGRQPESCELVYQYLPLVPHRRYRFRFQTDARDPGLFWQILDTRSPIARPDFVFESSDASLARLALIYRRPTGSVRLEGSITLRDLALGFAE